MPKILRPQGWKCAERAAIVAVAALLLCVEARDLDACEGTGEQVAAYAIGFDRYAIRVDPVAELPPRFVVRRLSTGEPLDNVTCAGVGRCELTDVLGVRGCSYTPLRSSRMTLDLELGPAPDGGARWILSQGSKSGRVGLLTMRADGALELRVARIVGRRVLLVVRETIGGSCPVIRERVVTLDEAELRPGRAREGRVREELDLNAYEELDMFPAPRFASPFRPMPAKMVMKAARIAVASGMERLAACWIQNNAAAMSARARISLRRRLADDHSLSRFSSLTLKHGGASRRPTR